MKIKRLVSFSLTLSFIPLVLSSLIVWVSPRGRIARQTDWEVLGLDKWQWQDMHVVVGWFFVGACLLHLILNWGVLMNYLRDRAKQTVGSKRELFVATLLVLVLCAGTAAEIPPFSWVIDIGHSMSGWVEENAQAGDE